LSSLNKHNKENEEFNQSNTNIQIEKNSKIMDSLKNFDKNYGNNKQNTKNNQYNLYQFEDLNNKNKKTKTLNQNITKPDKIINKPPISINSLDSFLKKNNISLNLKGISAFKHNNTIKFDIISPKLITRKEIKSYQQGEKHSIPISLNTSSNDIKVEEKDDKNYNLRSNKDTKNADILSTSTIKYSQNKANKKDKDEKDDNSVDTEVISFNDNDNDNDSKNDNEMCDIDANIEDMDNNKHKNDDNNKINQSNDSNTLKESKSNADKTNP
jgi:hypothetical protein